jgi:3-oxoacyl-[acyl-carrier protein] reductase
MAPIFPDLKGKKILVTGASRGIGNEIAKNLAAQGAHVVFNFRDGKEELTEALKTELLDLGAANVTPLRFDLRHEKQMKDSLDSFLNEFGPITGLVNNAGVSKDQIILRLKSLDLSDTLDTNLKGPILLTSLLSRHFLKGENVSIVNMSSIVGMMGNSSQIAYASSKAGLLGFTKSLAKELAGKKVRCNAISPGFIQTDMTDDLDPKVKDHYLTQIPLKRWGLPQEVAYLVCFLLSEASSYITGEIIKIDGGLYI